MSRSMFVAASLLISASLLIAPGGQARAEKADRDKPINVEADRMQYDDLKQVNVFTGNVTMTKGTIVIKGDRVVIRQDPEGYQYGTAWGKPATFRQRRDGPADQYVEGEALELDYDGKTEIYRLKQNAVMKRLEKDRVTDEVHGSLIVYESLTEFVTVESNPNGGPATASNPGGRVKMVIQPKNPAGAANGAGAPNGPPAAIRPDTRLHSVPTEVTPAPARR